jgi:DNA-binding MarR family transcriptional regulator
MNDVPIVRLLSMAVSVSLERLHAELAAAGHPALRPAHGYALNAIMNGSSTASAIAPRLGMTKQGAAKVLQALLDEGYVEPAVSGEDGRAKPVVLTGRGRDAVATSVRIQREIEQSWAADVGERRIASMRRVLESVVRPDAAHPLPPARPPG